MKKLLIGLTLLASMSSFATYTETVIKDLIQSRDYRELKKVCKANKYVDIMAERVYATCLDAESKEPVTVFNSFGMHRECRDVEDLIIVQRGTGNDQVRITSVDDFESSEDDLFAAQSAGFFSREPLNSVSIDFSTGSGIAISNGQYGQEMNLINCESSDEVRDLFLN
jgi:hypothetical protein